MSRLVNKVVVITGGAGAIGVAAAKLFTSEGALVVLVDVSESALKEASDTIGSDCVSVVVADVTCPQGTQRYIRAALDRHQRIDVVLANAGIEGATTSITDYPLEMFDKVMAVNVRGVFLGLQQVIPVMAEQGGGSIVITASILALKGAAAGAAYSASKHAVIGLMRSTALECAPLGIRVNAVCPAYLDSAMMQRVAEIVAPDAREQYRERLQKQIPVARLGSPQDVAQLMLFLASDESRFCTGGVHTVDGGMSAR